MEEEISNTLYFVKYGTKVLDYPTLKDAKKAREIWQKIYPQFNVEIYVGERYGD